MKRYCLDEKDCKFFKTEENNYILISLLVLS